MEISEYAWWIHNNNPNGAKDVAQLKPNEWHLYDIAGNVYEFVWDLGSEERIKSRFDYKGPESGPMSERQRMVRGGRYDYRSVDLTAWYRVKTVNIEIDFNVNIGFRTVRRAD
jgi:formylglycine-generating enzyme required for sulfatase activity